MQGFLLLLALTSDDEQETMVNEQTPREVDTRLAELAVTEERAIRLQTSAMQDVHRAAHDTRSYGAGHPRVARWQLTDDEALQQAAIRSLNSEKARSTMTNWTAVCGQLGTIRAETAELDAIYQARLWNRYFLVTNGNGHVHREMTCRTCYPTTQYAWLPELSGCDEAEMITEFGEKACTVCFPDAPANPSYHAPGRRDREAIDARETAKAVRESVKAAKNLTEAEQFKDVWGWVTTVAGCKKVLRDEVEYRDFFGHGTHSYHEATARAAEKATAVLLGRGVTQAEIDKIIENAVERNRKFGAKI